MTPAGAAVPPLPARRAGVFIDADNLNNATALDHVFAILQGRNDRIVYKRAYGHTESLRAIGPALGRHGIRPVANMVLSKVTTDSTLVIDAVEAVCSGAIDILALCSGDADFVPLATWAREKGCQVLCFSLEHKIFANPEGFFDEVVLLERVDLPGPLQEAAAALATAVESAALASRLAACSPVPTDSVLGSAFSSTLDSTVQQVLAAFPALCTGKPQHLGQVVAALRAQGILGKTTKTTAWFARWSAVFRLTPQPAAHQITYFSTEQDAQPVAAHAVPAPAPSLAPVSPVAAMALSPALPDGPVQDAGVPVLALQKASLVRAPAQAVRTPPPVPPEVQRILQAVPALRQCPQMLCQLVPVLREKNILGQTARSVPFFASLAAWFQLRPARQPTQLVYLPPGKAVQARGGQHEKKPARTAFKAATAPAIAMVPCMALSWTTTAGRRPAPPLPAQLHGLRSVLLQRALRSVGVADVLLAVPELLQGRPCALSAVAGRWRERGLLHSSRSALRILERHPGAFEVALDCAPQTVVCLR